MTCEPEVLDEKEYVAAPDERVNEDTAVVPSTLIETVPVGAAVAEVDAEETLMVMVSLTPGLGLLLDAKRVVLEACNDEAVVAGHAFKRL